MEQRRRALNKIEEFLLTPIRESVISKSEVQIMANAKELFAETVTEAVAICLESQEFKALVLAGAQELLRSVTGQAGKPVAPRAKRGRPRKAKAAPAPKAEKTRVKRGSLPKLVWDMVARTAGPFSGPAVLATVQANEPKAQASSVNGILKKMLANGMIEAAGSSGRTKFYRLVEKVDQGLADGARITDPIPEPAPEPVGAA